MPICIECRNGAVNEIIQLMGWMPATLCKRIGHWPNPSNGEPCGPVVNMVGLISHLIGLGIASG